MPVNLDQTNDGYLIKTQKWSVCSIALPSVLQIWNGRKLRCQTEGAVN